MAFPEGLSSIDAQQETPDTSNECLAKLTDSVDGSTGREMMREVQTCLNNVNSQIPEQSDTKYRRVKADGSGGLKMGKEGEGRPREADPLGDAERRYDDAKDAYENAKSALEPGSRSWGKEKYRKELPSLKAEYEEAKIALNNLNGNESNEKNEFAGVKPKDLMEKNGSLYIDAVDVINKGDNQGAIDDIKNIVSQYVTNAGYTLPDNFQLMANSTGKDDKDGFLYIPMGKQTMDLKFGA